MTTLYARLNIQVTQQDDNEAAAHRLEAVLHDAAIDGYADDFEIFYIERLGVVGVSVPFDSEQAWSVFEAGQVLGYVQCRVEGSGLKGQVSYSWSFVDADGNLIDSSAGF